MVGERRARDHDAIVMVHRHGVGDRPVGERGLLPVVAEERVQVARSGGRDARQQGHEDGDPRPTNDAWSS